MTARTGNTYRGVVVHHFPTEDEAVRAIRALQSAGFSSDDISVIARDKDAARGVAHDTGTEAAEGAATGAVAGGVLGAVAALIAGASAIAIPGVGIAIGGPIAAAIAGAAGGGLVGGLIGMGIPEEEAKRYDEHLKRGDILVTVVAGDRADEARSILQSGGAGSGQDVTGYATRTTTTTTTTDADRLTDTTRGRLGDLDATTTTRSVDPTR